MRIEKFTHPTVGEPVTLAWFDGVGEFVDACDEQIQAMAKPFVYGWDVQFCGGRSAPAAIKDARHGRDDLVAEATRLVDRIADLDVELPKRQWHASQAGAFPCVPAYLAGDPESMMQFVDESSDVSPVRIFVATTLSYDVRQHDIMRRGASILAFLMKVSQIRPVELYVYGEMDTAKAGFGWNTPVIKVDTAPLHLGIAANMLASGSFVRGLMYNWAQSTIGFNGHWMFDYGSLDKRTQAAREGFNAGPTDLVLGGLLSGTDIVRNPEKWIRDTIESMKLGLE